METDRLGYSQPFHYTTLLRCNASGRLANMGGLLRYTGGVRFTVPIPEKVSLNKIYSGIHFRTRSRHKDAYHYAVLASGAPKYNGPFPCIVHYHFRLNGSRLDVSNHAYMVKLVEDGLVSAGVLPEDDQQVVKEIRTTTEYVPKGKGQNEVEVTISV